jgi:hypothetical protein
VAKYNRAPKVRRVRRWFENVGDPRNLGSNPNDQPKVRR